MCMEVLVDHGEMELEYDHLYNYVAFSRYPTGCSKNQRCIIRRKCIESTFMQRMECSTTLHAEGSANKMK